MSINEATLRIANNLQIEAVYLLSGEIRLWILHRTVSEADLRPVKIPNAIRKSFMAPLPAVAISSWPAHIFVREASEEIRRTKKVSLNGSFANIQFHSNPFKCTAC
jgi:hypothetical protein